MKRIALLAITASLGAAAFGAPPALAQTPYIGEVRVFPYTFCPRSWQLADGSLIAIAQHNALFSLYGTTFGGNGTATFALPDLRGRTPMGTGHGPGLSVRRQGEILGQEFVTLTIPEMPQHNHLVQGSSAAGNTGSMNNAGFGDFTGVLDAYRSEGALSQTTRIDAITTTGGGLPHENRQPSLALRYCVAMEGLYPSRP